MRDHVEKLIERIKGMTFTNVEAAELVAEIHRRVWADTDADACTCRTCRQARGRRERTRR